MPSPVETTVYRCASSRSVRPAEPSDAHIYMFPTLPYTSFVLRIRQNFTHPQKPTTYRTMLDRTFPTPGQYNNLKHFDVQVYHISPASLRGIGEIMVKYQMHFEFGAFIATVSSVRVASWCNRIPTLKPRSAGWSYLKTSVHTGL